MALPSKEAALLGTLLGAGHGVRCVDAGAVERCVVERCDTAAELERRRADLNAATQELTRLELRLRRLGKESAEAHVASDDKAAEIAELETEINIAKQKRQKVHDDVKELQLRASSQHKTSLSDLPTLTFSKIEPTSMAAPPSKMWGTLKSGSSLDLDDDSDDEEDVTAEPKKASNVSGSSPSQGAPRETTHESRQQAPKCQRAVKSRSTMSAKEYLSRLRNIGSRKAAPAMAPGALLATKAVLASSATMTAPLCESASEAKRSRVDSVNPPSTPTKREMMTRVEQQKSPEPVLPLRQAASQVGDAAVKDGGNLSGRTYQIDVNQLVPKPAQNPCKWKDAFPGEYKAMISQGEIVSPEQNLLKRRFGEKRNKSIEDDPDKKKVCRADDKNEASYQRRQNLFKRGIGGTSVALCPKQQVDDAGNPIKEESSEGNEVAKLEFANEGVLQDDVHIAEGMRCPRWLWEALYPYQHECVRWLCQLQCNSHGGIIADEMGLGKTIQIVAYLAVLHHSGLLQKMQVQNSSLSTAAPSTTGGVLVVVPATLISQWRSELHLWYPPLRVCVMHQINEEERREAIHVASSQHGILLTSYETMVRSIDDLVEAAWVLIVLDEGQRIRNSNTNAAAAVKRFSTPHRIVLSGSPIQNRLQELWSLFDFICPGRLGTLPVFLEEFAEPIEQGNLMNATPARVATAYHCACALRELTMPCIMRRTKAEVLDVIQLPHKQEQVLFCNLTPEQYQVYIDFLNTEQVNRAKRAGIDRKAAGACFFALSVLRKLCNHPDLLLLGTDQELQPDDMWNFERSGKMKVLAEIMKLWHKEGHRALIFVQTIQLLEVVRRWMDLMGYRYLRVDGKTAVRRRGRLIEEFNGNGDIFAMVLTTRVGGVGLNIIGADRVVIFDPDWNPMTDVQARERAWRIGQKRDVAVYRLVLTGTIEEKIYQRQVYKHFLSQKVLNDPRQRQFFKWSDMADLFEVPPMPPNFDPQEAAALKAKYRDLFKKMPKEDDVDEHTETTEVMHAISSLPMIAQHTCEETAEEHNTILQTLYDTQGIKATFNHDKVEQPCLDRKLVREGAGLIAQRAVQALKQSAEDYERRRKRDMPWHGHSNRNIKSELPIKHESKVKSEPGSYNGSLPSHSRLAATSSVSSNDILRGLKQLAAMRAAQRERHASQADDAARMGIAAKYTSPMPAQPQCFIQDGVLRQGVASVVKKEPQSNETDGDKPGPSTCDFADPAMEEELHPSDRRIAELILNAFLDLKIAGKEHRLSTEQVLHVVGQDVAPHHNDLFKSLLKQLCHVSKSEYAGGTAIWTLRRDFWPPPARPSALKTEAG